MTPEERVGAGQELRVLTLLLAKTWQRDLERRLGARQEGLSGLQYGILHAIRHHPHTISELSRMFMLDPSTLVPSVDALERNGLARRGKDPQDRRRTPLLLTEAGAELLDAVPYVADDDAILRALDGLGDAGARELIALLRDLAQPIVAAEPALAAMLARLRGEEPAEEQP
jgi:DNA-binding MarR family transcriptional regulator